MSNGLGEYFSQSEAPSPAPAPIPPPAPRRAAPVAPPSTGMGEYFAQNGLGVVTRPLGRPGGIGKAARKLSPAIGALGDASDVISDAKTGAITGVAAAGALMAVLIGIGLRFGAGWVVGTQLAPNRSDETKYAWGGALGSVFLGTLGLGIEALVAQHAKK